MILCKYNTQLVAVSLHLIHVQDAPEIMTGQTHQPAHIKTKPISFFVFFPTELNWFPAPFPSQHNVTGPKLPAQVPVCE